MQYYWLLLDLHCSRVLSFVELWIQEFLNGVIFHLSSHKWCYISQKLRGIWVEIWLFLNLTFQTNFNVVKFFMGSDPLLC